MGNYRYNKLGYSIEISLQGNYVVRANILRSENNTYDVTLEMKRSDVGKYDTLDEEHYSLTGENINMEVCKFVTDKANEGFFERFINRYEYESQCFERGNELFEKERIGEK